MNTKYISSRELKTSKFSLVLRTRENSDIFNSLDEIYLSRIVRKPDFCLCENKGADQLRSNCEADQRLCFRYTDSTISLLLKSEISSFYLSSVAAQAGLCQTWPETPKTGFLASRLIWYSPQTSKYPLYIFTVDFGLLLTFPFT